MNTNLSHKDAVGSACRQHLTSALLFTHLCMCPKQDMEELMNTDRPDWQSVMQYVSQIYKYFET